MGAGLLLAACSTAPIPTPTTSSVHRARTPVGSAPSAVAATTHSYPVSSGFVPLSFSAISPARWWTLGFVMCGSRQCLALAGTTDAGATQTSIPVPGKPFGPGVAQPPEVASIRFANAEDGWAWGPDLFATHDGGRTWAQISLAGPVTALVVGGGTAYAIEQPPASAAPTTTTSAISTASSLLWQAPVSSNQWVRVANSPEVTGGLAASGSSIWVSNGTNLVTSSNSGKSFDALTNPVLSDPCDDQALSASLLWSYCDNHGLLFLYRSTDAGVSSALIGHSVLGQPNSPDGLPSASTSAVASTFGAASVSTVVVASSVAGSPLTQSDDGGLSFQAVQSAPDKTGSWSVLGFITPTVGFAFWKHLSYAYNKNSAQLWRTTDGGAHWAPAMTAKSAGP